MSEAQIHGGLQVTFPDGFEVMSEDELQQGYLDDNPNRWGIWDKGRHIIFVVSWQDSNAALVKLVSTKSLIKRAEKLSSKGYRNNAYQLDDFFATEVAGIKAEGFRFEYEVQGVAQKSETIIFKQGKTCYTLYWYSRAETFAQDEAIRTAILDSITLA